MTSCPPFRLLALTVFSVASLAAQENKPRSWTSTDGRTIEAVLIDADAETVELKTANGVFKLPVTRFSKADQTYITEWRGQAPLKIGPWPDKVEIAGELAIEEKAAGGEFNYFSPHFEFHSPTRLSKSVVREFARLFEATYEGVKALPVGLDPIPPGDGGHFLTKLFATREDYYASGGIPGSGGMFSWRSQGRKFVSGSISVPLTSLGVEQVGNRFIVDLDKDSGTLVHEITHQVAVMWGIYGAPVWFVEGLAEDMEAAPYSKGTMRFTNMPGSVEKSVMENGSGNEFRMLPVETLMTISKAQWADALENGDAGKNYKSANVLMTYFLHLDGTGNGEPVALYLRASRTGNGPERSGNPSAAWPGLSRTFRGCARQMAAEWLPLGIRQLSPLHQTSSATRSTLDVRPARTSRRNGSCPGRDLRSENALRPIHSNHRHDFAGHWNDRKTGDIDHDLIHGDPSQNRAAPSLNQHLRATIRKVARKAVPIPDADGRHGGGPCRDKGTAIAHPVPRWQSPHQADP